MFECNRPARAVIPEYLMLSRLAQSEQMREFFMQVWILSPALARQGEQGATPAFAFDGQH